MTNETTSVVQDKMQALRKRYLVQLQERLEGLERLQSLCQAQSLSEDDRLTLRTIAHKLAGTGSTFGFPQISEAGRTLELALVEQPSASIATLMPLLTQLTHTCQEALKT